MASLLHLLLHLLLPVILLLSPAHSLNCTTQKFTNKNHYSDCADLHTLRSYLHWTYNASNSSLSIAFTAAPSKSNGWVSWAINPTRFGMIGSQALVAVKHSNGTVSAQTYSLTSYSSVVPSKLSFDVWDLSAQYNDGNITIFATVKVPAKTEKLSHVWQVGPGINEATGLLEKHDFSPANNAAKATLDLINGTSIFTAPTSSFYPAPAANTTNTSSGNRTGGDGVKNGGVSLIGVSNYNLLGLCLVSLLVMVISI